MPRAGNNRSVAFVAVGAMLVGSCVQTAQPASEVSRGDELGYFGPFEVLQHSLPS